MNQLIKQQHRYRLTGADFKTPKTRSVLFTLVVLCVAFSLIYLAR